MKKFFIFIGLEIHIELNTKSKMFCSCKNDSLANAPNIYICPICLGHPGTLPVINWEAIKKTLKTGLALNCEINKNSFFERKSYFYPDLPKGYQISQYQAPLCQNGFLKIDGKKIRIERIHIEEDTGRLIHSKDYSLIDFNRAGIPLMELVTKPDLNSGKEARKFAQELRLLLKYLNVSDADMEKGQMRIEANLSLSDNPQKLGTRVEIKNLNSFLTLEKAINYEIERQREILQKGEKIFQQTLGWDIENEKTVLQREKEEAQDYRYFPDPDLPPLKISDEFLKEISQEIGELPWQKRERFEKQYNLGKEEIQIFIENKNLAEFFDEIISKLKVDKLNNIKKLAKLTCNYLLSDFLGLFPNTDFFKEKVKTPPEYFAQLISLIFANKITSKSAKSILQEMVFEGKNPLKIVHEKNLLQVFNENEIEKIVAEVICQNPKAIEDFKKGKEGVVQFLIGKVMEKTRGKANPQLTQKILIKYLQEK